MINTMPKLKAVFKGWVSPVEFVRFTQVTLPSGEVTNTQEPFNAMVVIQPLTEDKINLKPEGQRSFEWLQIHADTNQPFLKNNDRLVYNGRRFKVMGVKDFTLNGYREYHAIQDYNNA